MMYKATNDNWNWYEGVEREEDGQKVQDTIIHSWTVGKEYEINVDKKSNTVQFTSDKGTSQVIPALSCNKDLLLAVFGIDISDIIQNAINLQSQSLSAEYSTR